MTKTLVLLFAALLTLPAKENSDSVTVHEWGTFTSVALDAGGPARWAPWTGPADLPCFVYQTKSRYKFELSGTVRMETPVLYFYAPRALTLTVDVRFPSGMISEWYPQAAVQFKPKGMPSLADNGAIRWDNVKVSPNVEETFPQDGKASHYYAARATDADPVQVGNEREKLLFYRGVGNFVPPVAARFPGDGKLEIRNVGKEPIPLLIAFENRGGGKVGYRIAHGLIGEISLDPLAITQDVATLHTELQRQLVAAGLYEKEAAAMIATWRDSWFEPGTRVFYIMPRAAVDQVLPLAIKPAPATIARIFVGRVEVLSPWTEQTIAHAVKSGDVATLQTFGRFLQPFAAQMKLPSSPLLTEVQRKLSTEIAHTSCAR